MCIKIFLTDEYFLHWLYLGKKCACIENIYINIEREGVQKNKRHKYFEVSGISKLLWIYSYISDLDLGSWMKTTGFGDSRFCDYLKRL